MAVWLVLVVLGSPLGMPQGRASKGKGFLRRIFRGDEGKGTRRNGEPEQPHRIGLDEFVWSVPDPQRALAQQIWFAASACDKKLLHDVLSKHPETGGPLHPAITSFVESVEKQIYQREEKVLLDKQRLEHLNRFSGGFSEKYRPRVQSDAKTGLTHTFGSPGPAAPDKALVELFAAWKAKERLVKEHGTRFFRVDELTLWRQYLASREDYRTFYKPERWTPPLEGRDSEVITEALGKRYNHFDPHKVADKYSALMPGSGFIAEVIREAVRAADPEALDAALALYEREGGSLDRQRAEKLRTVVSRLRKIVDYWIAIDTATFATEEVSKQRYLAEAATLREEMRRETHSGDITIERAQDAVFKKGQKLEHEQWAQLGPPVP